MCGEVLGPSVVRHGSERGGLGRSVHVGDESSLVETVGPSYVCMTWYPQNMVSDWMYRGYDETPSDVQSVCTVCAQCAHTVHTVRRGASHGP